MKVEEGFELSADEKDEDLGKQKESKFFTSSSIMIEKGMPLLILPFSN